MLIPEAFEAYQPALMALSVLTLAVLVQSVLTAPLAFASGEQVPGAPLLGDHSALSFRVVRTHGNSVENLPVFGFAVLLAAVAGTNINLVNWLAGVHVVFRLACWAVYYSGWGRPSGGPRTLCFIGALLANLVLVVSALVTFA